MSYHILRGNRGLWSAGNHMFKNKEEFHMSFLSLTGVELKKIRRSGILWILVIPIFLIWLTGVINADINFTMGNEGYPRKITFLSRALWDMPGSCTLQVL